MELRLSGVYNALPHSTSRRLTRAEEAEIIHTEKGIATTKSLLQSRMLLHLMWGADSFPANPMESNLNSWNVGGASTDTDRTTSSCPRSDSSMGVSRRRKKENKMVELCKAINNVAETTREKHAIVRERNAAKITLSRMPWWSYQEWLSTERHAWKWSYSFMNQSGARCSLLWRQSSTNIGCRSFKICELLNDYKFAVYSPFSPFLVTAVAFVHCSFYVNYKHGCLNCLGLCLYEGLNYLNLAVHCPFWICLLYMHSNWLICWCVLLMCAMCN